MLCVTIKVNMDSVFVYVYMCILVNILQRNKNPKHSEYIERDLLQGLVHKIMEADKAQDMNPASWRPRTGVGVILF